MDHFSLKIGQLKSKIERLSWKSVFLMKNEPDSLKTTIFGQTRTAQVEKEHS